VLARTQEHVVTRAWTQRLAAEDGAGCLLYLAGIAAGTLALGLILDISGVLGWIGIAIGVWAIASVTAAVTWAQRRKRRREERRLRRARRAQRRALTRVGKRRYAERPIDETSPLPRQWWEPVSLARKAARDYRTCVESLPHGAVRDRLAEGYTAMQTGAAQLEGISRRGAELDRQLTRFRRRSEEANHRERIGTLTTRVEEARSRVAERLEAMQLAALDVANVAVSMSLADADELVSGVEHTLTGIAGVASAMDELDGGTASAHTTGRPAPQPPQGAPSPGSPSPHTQDPVTQQGSSPPPAQDPTTQQESASQSRRPMPG
jgi:hypothetical protein